MAVVWALGQVLGRIPAVIVLALDYKEKQGFSLQLSARKKPFLSSLNNNNFPYTLLVKTNCTMGQVKQ